MRGLFVALILVLLGLVAPIPVHAQPMDTCPHAPTIQSLRECVQHAAQLGHIDNRGVARSLIGKLDAAQAALDRGQPEVALNLLEAFVRAVRAQAGKHIVQEHADHMLLHAREIIAALSG